MDMTARTIEKVEVLDGTRSRQKGRAAVRIDDLAPLLQIKQMQAAKAAGATPTQAEFDALLADFNALHARLLELSQILTKRLL